LLASLTAALLLAVTTVLHAASSELPSLGEDSAINIKYETHLGRSVYERLLAAGLVETHPLLDRYINELGFRLLAGIENRARDYRFFIVRDDAVNAFALPGGFIGINRGLIRQAHTQHQLASVMAHEIAHVRLMHGLDMMKKSGEVSNATLLTMLAGLLLGSVDSQVGSAVLYGGAAAGQQAMVNFTRENEYEADRIGIELLPPAWSSFLPSCQNCPVEAASSICVLTRLTTTVLRRRPPAPGVIREVATRSITTRCSRITCFMSAAIICPDRVVAICAPWRR
jgi:predicted Zn-dependent protease